MIKIKLKQKYAFYAALILLSAVFLAGCKGNGANAADGDEAVATSDNSDAADEEDANVNKAFQNAANTGSDSSTVYSSSTNPASNSQGGLTADEVLAQPTLDAKENNQGTIPEGINVVRNNNNVVPADPYESGDENPQASSVDDTAATGSSSETDSKTTPQFFDVGDCFIEVGGDYNTANVDVIISKINALRAAYNIPPCTKNTSLCKVADVRAKELIYLWSPLRPDGSMWNSVAPQYYMAECTSCTTAQGGVDKATDGIISGTVSRKNIMNEKYLSIGASYFQCGDLVYEVITMGY